jgi:iron(III) transport system permease protein
LRVRGEDLAHRDRPPLGLLAPALVASGLALLPLGYLAIRAVEDGADRAAGIVLRERTAELIVSSLGLAAVVTAACLVVGITLAWLVVRTRLPGRRLWGVLCSLPLAIPSYVAAYAWVAAAPRLQGFTGAALVLVACSYPYVYLPVAAALERMDPALEEVARSLGRSPLRTFLTVTLRQLRPAAAAGGLLVALYVLADFGAVSIMRYDAFTRAIYASYRASFDRTPAAVLGSVLVLATVLIVLAEARSRGRAGYARIGGGTARQQAPVALGRWAVPALGWCVLVIGVAAGFPLVSIGFWLVRGASAALDPGALAGAALATLRVSAVGALVTTALAIPVGIIAARHRGRLARLLEQATYAGHALPGIVVALSLVFFAIRFAYPLYQRTPLLVLAYAVLFLPAAVGAVRASVLQSPPLLEEVARSLGRTPARVLREITLPLALPGVAAGAALVFLTCMKELPATLLLRPTGMDTLATELWTATGASAYAGAAPYAALLILLAAGPAYLLGRRTRLPAAEAAS